jgi:hypothetical protein
MNDETSQYRQMRRRKALEQAAEALGYQSWSSFETDVVNDRIILTVTPKPLADRKPLVRPSPFVHLPKRKPSA